MSTKRNKTLRYKVTLCERTPVIKFFNTADEIVDALGCGLSKDIIYRKVKISRKDGHAYTGYRMTPHRHILVERLPRVV